MSPGTSPQHVDGKSFRAALGSFATGVAVVAVFDAEGHPAGFTASSLTSVSLDPPLILFCIGREAKAAPAFEGVRSFAVNVLAAGQESVSQAFAEDPRAWLATGAWAPGERGPLLAGRVAGIECDVERVDEGGDHWIVLGRVVRVDWDEGAEPLVHFRGGYRGLA